MSDDHSLSATEPEQECTGLFSDARDCPVHKPSASLPASEALTPPHVWMRHIAQEMQRLGDELFEEAGDVAQMAPRFEMADWLEIQGRMARGLADQLTAAEAAAEAERDRLTAELTPCFACGLRWQGAYTDCPGCLAQAGMKGCSDLGVRLLAREATVGQLQGYVQHQEECDTWLREIAVNDEGVESERCGSCNCGLKEALERP